MKLHEYLMSHLRGQGKTHKLAELTKQVGGTLIVRNQHEARRVSQEYGISTLSFQSDPRFLAGRNLGITYVDPDAVGLWVDTLEAKIRMLETQIEALLRERLL